MNITIGDIELVPIIVLVPQHDLAVNMNILERDSPPKINLNDMIKSMEQVTDYLNMFSG